ncbi:hypothetical protein [Stenotrophomonas sp. YAU14A_MKIMI4_1]|uniref:hypothetical protein n=1 Tax=Stenotrophomonas sp. YAU14A_MKIMI4_1 TaxID=2072408 RepID=UPI00131F3322|nr:hypothetical protein [Stenotrophomonas sp. YAU14A_MKIMI4_1]
MAVSACRRAACLLGLALSGLAQASAPVRTGDDNLPLEYTSVAAFAEKLPQRKDIERLQAQTPAGMVVLQTSKETVENDPDYTATTWVLFTAPHPLAPSVVRMRTAIGWDREHPFRRTRKIATLCEGSTAACDAVAVQARKLAAAPL